MEAHVTLTDGTPVTICTKGNYPFAGRVQVEVRTGEPREFTLALRIPEWSSSTMIHVADRQGRGQMDRYRTGVKVAPVGRSTFSPGNNICSVSSAEEPVAAVRPGEYCLVRRTWSDDQLTIEFDLSLRYETGDLQQSGRIALYRGPILLAADDRFQSLPTAPVAVGQLSAARVLPRDDTYQSEQTEGEPALMVEVPSRSDHPLRLIDFASAGATSVAGVPRSRYESWLPAQAARPPRPVADLPPNHARFSAGDVTFSWRRTLPATHTWHEVIFYGEPLGDSVVQRHRTTDPRSITVEAADLSRLAPGKPYYWSIVRGNEFGVSTSRSPRKQFVVDPSAPPAGPVAHGARSRDGMLTEAQLRGDPNPEYGQLLEAVGWTTSAGPTDAAGSAVELDGVTGRLKYQIAAFPEEDYSVALWVQLQAYPQSNYGQVFSAWTAGMDDPLRLVVEGQRLFARIEAHQAYGTEGVALKLNRWYHVGAVKEGPQLTLYLDGRSASTTQVPESIWSASTEIAVGGNPRFSGPEFLAARFCDLRFFARALSSAEVQRLAKLLLPP
jgi:hypothetical protein